MKAAFLTDRGVIKLSGDDARGFLNNLVTSEIEVVKPGLARFAALLTPQGKIIADFLVTEAPAGIGGGLLIDLPRELAAPLATKLGFYKLRAKVAVENLTDALGVLAVWGGDPAMKPDLTFPDPRNAALGFRILIPAELAEKTAAVIGAELVGEADYEAHRIAAGVPRGGVDFAYGDAFPHESNMDRLYGVNFDKGCYVGQEVVARMQHRGTARTRIVGVVLDGEAPAPGSEIRAADRPIGTMGSSAAGRGLALIRTDRATDAMDAEAAFLAGGAPIHFADPDAVRAFAPKKTIA
jgi:folate-binding protein YgfZ